MQTRGTMMTVLGAAVMVASVLLAGPAEATIKCRAAFSKETGKLTQALAKIQQQCAEGVRAGKIAGPCPDAKSAGKIAKAKDKIAAAVAKACGTSTGEFAYGSCPDAELPSGTGVCSALVQSKSDEGSCVACLADQNASARVSFVYSDFTGSPSKEVAKCQATIGKAASAYVIARSKALGGCQASVLKGKVSPPCPDAKAAGAIAGAASKLQSAICKACGGADKACGGGDDLAVAAIGFPTDCPARDGGFIFSFPITTVSELVACTQGLADDHADCMDQAGVPGSLPSKCTQSGSSCDSDAGTVTVQVSLSTTTTPLGGVSIALGYRDMSIPGTGAGAAASVTSLQSGLSEVNDEETQLIYSITDIGGGVVAGPLFTIDANTCAGGPPIASDFGCVVSSASTLEGAEVLQGVSCTVSIL